MENIEREKFNPQNLVQDDVLPSLDEMKAALSRTKKRIRRIAEPHIESFQTNGQVYYRYRRGEDTPIYLGGPDYILEAVKAYKIASGKNDGRSRV